MGEIHVGSIVRITRKYESASAHRAVRRSDHLAISVPPGTRALVYDIEDFGGVKGYHLEALDKTWEMMVIGSEIGSITLLEQLAYCADEGADEDEPCA